MALRVTFDAGCFARKARHVTFECGWDTKNKTQHDLVVMLTGLLAIGWA